MFEKFIEGLKKAIQDSLPGKEAHLRLAPEVRKGEIKIGKIPTDAQIGAVLILLYEKNESIYTAVILRNEYDGVHSGQISLPGGKFESRDIDFMQTALRETHEEIGISQDSVNMIGQLSTFYVIPSNFVIHPFIGYLEHSPVFSPDPAEVQKVIEIDLLNELVYSKVKFKELKFRNFLSIHAPGFIVENEFMWGATAMIFSELIKIIEEISKNRNAID